MEAVNSTIKEKLSGYRRCHILLILLMPFCSCTVAWDVPSTVCRLNVEAENGSVIVEPDQPLYRIGDRVTLTARADPVYDFLEWQGDRRGGENPLVITMSDNVDVTAVFTTYDATVYYVDFDNGSDSYSGLSPGNAWKHAPGDPQAEFNAALAVLRPGNRVLFRGGTVYRGGVVIPAGGSYNNHIVYQGDAWPGLEGTKAVIDGGDVVTGWTQCLSAEECSGNENYASIYYARVTAEVDALALNLHEYSDADGTDEFLWPSQEPDPVDSYFFDDYHGFRVLPQSCMTLTSIRDEAFFIQDDPDYWNGSYLLVWVNPNMVSLRKITGYTPGEHRVYFDPLGENALYPDGRDQYYALYNSIHAVDRPGEYSVTTEPDEENRYTIYLWPRSVGDLFAGITRSVRTVGIDMGSRSNIDIRGFVVKKHCGTALRDGVGIGTVSAAHLDNYNVIVKDNVVTHNRKGGDSMGYGGIFLQNCTGVLVENNLVDSNPRHAGIFVGGGKNVIVRDNAIIRSGSTALRLYTVERGLVQGNMIHECNGSHANGITIYIGSKNILVAGNAVTDCNSPITLQDSGNLWFVNNIVDAGNGESNVNEWGDTGHGPWERGVIAFFHNTLVRNSRNASLNIGTVPGENTYIVMNNILDGGPWGDAVLRGYNLYTGLSWSQNSYYGWYPAGGEFTEEDLSLVFNDPEGGDFSLSPDSPARDAGGDISPFYPVGLFPEYDFNSDIDGNPRSELDLGAGSYIP